jgi:glycosyltransferase involved in cell wall biosynthesis|tara:strand:- start:1721 stop:2566 length:846 start_codon:yes stop_codon:yes gene_type:complete
MFSIIIPTYNNLNYLSLCLNSIHKNSKYNHEIILHVNEGSDGTIDFVKSHKIIHTYSADNVGLCSGVNLAAKKATKNYILYSHDDMYFCPGWDIALENEIIINNTKLFYLSSTMIEQNSGHIQFDCGKNFEEFKENKLLNNLSNLSYYNHQGSHWAPHLIHREIWNKIGGFSEEFNPGMGSDPDLNMKLWNEGVRIFKGLENFKVYHFVSISLRKKKDLKKNNGARTFLKKWGISVKFFKKHYLKTNTEYKSELKEPVRNFVYFKDYFITKIYYFVVKYFK